MKKDIIILSAAFFLIFLSFNTAQQYFAAVYSDFGKEQIAAYSLATAYFFFFLGTFIAAPLTGKIGLKKSMAIASIGYAVFIAAIPLKVDWLVLLFGAIVGVCAAILWTAEGAYIIKATEEKSRATTIGIFISCVQAGSFIGIFGTSFLIEKLGFETSFFGLSGIVILGTLTLLILKEERDEAQKSDFKGILKMLKTKALLFFPLFFAAYMLMGFFVSSIMLHLKELNGIEFAGKITSVFWLTTIIAPLLAGKVAEKIGNVKALKSVLLLLLAGITSLLFLKTPISIITAIIFLGLFFASVLNVGLAAISNTSKNKNEVAAYFQFSATGGGVFALLISGNISHSVALYITGIVGVISLIALFFAKEN